MQAIPSYLDTDEYRSAQRSKESRLDGVESATMQPYWVDVRQHVATAVGRCGGVT
jgi:hypothetical protein